LITSIRLTDIDFEQAMHSLVPAAHRSSMVVARSVPNLLEPLLNSHLGTIKASRCNVWLMQRNHLQDDSV